MKAINKHENYISFNINDIGPKNLNSLIKRALKLCVITSVSEQLDCYEIPMYKTQVPYNSGFIQDRFVYHNTTGVTDFIIKGIEQPNAFDLFFCVYTCWDFYDGHDLVLSINIVQGIVTVNGMRIGLNQYGYRRGEPTNE